ncbi:MAG TPA: threonine--tRNA ligase [Candidatus Korarchaeota archaeon]|nr:threonine--tRNA ligase [Candidatus Korarchaeota archaeon]
MKCLIFHAKEFYYEVVERTSAAEEIGEEVGKRRLRECLVVFSAVEKEDEGKGEIPKIAASEISKVAEELSVEEILIYPYAHLSPSLASPIEAVHILDELVKQIAEMGFNVSRAPFGYIKRFSLSIKGHPRAESFRSFSVEKAREKELGAREHPPSDFFILTPEDRLIPVRKFEFEDEEFKSFVEYEIGPHSRLVIIQPPHVELMKKLGLVDYDKYSDVGNMRWYPAGRMMKKAIEEYVFRKVMEFGAMPIETSIIVRLEHPAILKQVNSFPARQYRFEIDGKEMILRVASDYLLFGMASDLKLSYRNLPARFYELAKSFRYEKRGEVVGLRRLRAFTMPDLHTFCSDMDQAIEEFRRQFELCREVMEELGIRFQVAFRVVREFFDENREWIVDLVRKAGKPALIEIFPEKFAYWVIKFEFNFVDAVGKAAALSTVQLDVDTSSRYGIRYVDKEGDEKKAIILHCSPSGAVERVIYAILESSCIAQEKGEVPELPIWLCPVQVRLIPVADRHLGSCIELAKRLKSHGIRVEVDDRNWTVEKRVREAELDWIPYIVVFGDRELEGGKLPVRIRGIGAIREMELEELVSEIAERIRGFPSEPQPLPMILSKKISF